ncbi:MAG TPA: hypothetical protein PLC98_19900 [Anaerolineales bacterium]|nr:hypothetical protein [Anaerolineales bacterium]
MYPAIQQYRTQTAENASPVRLVVMAFDAAILACEKHDLARGTHVVSTLRDALNFDEEEAAMGFFRLYQWVMECMRHGDWDEAIKVLRELRGSWAEIERRANSIATVDSMVAISG